MQSLSPTILRLYLECPRYYYLAFVKEYGFIPSSEESFDSLLIHQANQFIYHYFPHVIGNNSYKMDENHVCCDFEITGILNQKISQVLDFLINQIKRNAKFTGPLQLIITPFIQSADHLYQGKPSALIFSSRKSTAIFSHIYRNEYPQTKNFGFFQALIYAYIIKSHNFMPEEFLYVNYKSGRLMHHKIQEEDFNQLEIVVKSITQNIEEERFHSLPNSPCNYCEFEILCRNGDLTYG